MLGFRCLGLAGLDVGIWGLGWGFNGCYVGLVWYNAKRLQHYLKGRVGLVGDKMKF